MFNDFNFLLEDRIAKIQSINNKYDLENNAYISFSGGKDSTVLHYLIDLALPNNKIPRVFINTGIEYNDIVLFVKQLKEIDDRFVIIAPSKNIKETLEIYGYPFKSKEHSLKISEYKRGSRAVSVLNYKNGFNGIGHSRFQCPKKLLYQYEDDFKLNISNKCCYKLKKEPIHEWEINNSRTIALTGMRKSEGGQRANIVNCIVILKDKIVKFHPLLVVSDEWENDFIKEYNIKLCRLYYNPFNFERTGCKGCPFNLKLAEQLEIMKKYLPNEYKQCEIIWKSVYDEYRRIGFRLKKKQQYQQMTIYDFIDF